MGLVEINRRADPYALRARPLEMVVEFRTERLIEGDPLDWARAQAVAFLAAPLLGTPLRSGSSRRYDDGAFVEIVAPEEAAFVGGMCPSLWVYADRRVLVCAYEFPVDSRGEV